MKLKAINMVMTPVPGPGPLRTSSPCKAQINKAEGFQQSHILSSVEVLDLSHALLLESSVLCIPRILDTASPAGTGS